jgi:formyl-CoA transferase
MFQPQQHPAAGAIVAVRPATLFARTPAELALPAPTLGEHSVAVLQEAGLSEAEIDALCAGQIISTKETPA